MERGRERVRTRARAMALAAVVGVALVGVLGGGVPRAWARPVEPGASAGAPYVRGHALVPIGALDLGGFSADVWVLDRTAYVGTWGTDVHYPLGCPASGVRIVDLADPTAPALLGSVAAIPATSQEKPVVRRVETTAFSGDLLAVGVQACTAGHAPRGVDLWDVTDPRAPRHLAFWSSAAADGSGARGVHELDLVARDGRAYVAAAVPSAELIQGVGDLQLIDVTDPTRPVQVGDWGARRDAGAVDRPGMALFAHSARFGDDGRTVVVSYWDGGVFLLDIADPTHPRQLGPPLLSGIGKAHSVWPARRGTLLLTAEELLAPAFGVPWGGVGIWDVRDPAHPAAVAHLATADASGARRDGGTYTAHNPIVRGDTAYVSWYSDGVRVFDLTDPSHPVEVAAFVPPPTADPFGLIAPFAQVWGVALAGPFVVLSDMNAGLLVLEDVRLP